MPSGRALVIALLCILGSIPLSGGEKTITIGLIPDGLSQRERMPLQEYLSKQMGSEIRFVTPNSYTDMITGLSNGSIDFACLGGVTYVRSRAKIGVLPLVQRTTDLQFRALFIAGANSRIYSLSDLRGKKFAFGDMNSTSGHVIPYLELKRAGMNPVMDFDSRYTGGHPLTVKLVETGIVDAGAVDETFFSSMVSSGKIDGKKVRVFYTSRPFVDYVWVARKGMSEAERAKFATAFLELKEGQDDDVLKVLRATKFVRATDESYASLRQVVHELKML